MYDLDALLAALGGGILAVGFVAAAIGGLVTPVTGHWRDGDRTVDLWQLGPRLFGDCRREAGRERYRGWAFFGRVWLARASFGAGLLQSMGLPSSALRALDGAVTGRFRFRLDGDTLSGDFRGTHFRFTGKPEKLTGARLAAPTAREWVRSRPDARSGHPPTRR